MTGHLCMLSCYMSLWCLKFFVRVEIWLSLCCWVGFCTKMTRRPIETHLSSAYSACRPQALCYHLTQNDIVPCLLVFKSHHPAPPISAFLQTLHEDFTAHTYSISLFFSSFLLSCNSSSVLSQPPLILFKSKVRISSSILLNFSVTK